MCDDFPAIALRKTDWILMDSHLHFKLEDIELHCMAPDAKKTKNASVEKKEKLASDRAPRRSMHFLKSRFLNGTWTCIAALFNPRMGLHHDIQNMPGHSNSLESCARSGRRHGKVGVDPNRQRTVCSPAGYASGSCGAPGSACRTSPFYLRIPWSRWSSVPESRPFKCVSKQEGI